MASGFAGENGADTYPLAGMRVLDLSSHAVGPFATQILAGLGAAVIKIERPPAGDLERVTEPPMFYACNQGKHSIALDTAREEDRRLLDDLIRDCHVLVEGFRPGTVKRMGIDFERVTTELRPDIIYVSLPGFGSSGPYADRRAYDTELRALSGDIWLNRDRDGMPRYAHSVPNFDYACAMYAVIGILAVWANRDGTPHHIESSILGAGLAWAFARLIPGHGEQGSLKEYVFRGSDDKFFTITAADARLFAALCQLIGRPELEKDGRPTVTTPELNRILADEMAKAPRAEWLRRFEEVGVASAPVLEPAEVFADPQVAHLGVIGLQPQPWSRAPIFGLPVRPLTPPPAIDQSGVDIRAGGWKAIEDVLA
jgi:crotonobetainyl-CoA:carnitine CoA-transferase CaiB-like acyl-CoA transferase